KVRVLTSASAPCGGISLPLSRKLTPDALPTLTVISWAARMAVLAGAIRVSWTTGCPSAMTEIQVVSDARILRVKTGGALAAGAALENFRSVTSRSEEGRSEEEGPGAAASRSRAAAGLGALESAGLVAS